MTDQSDATLRLVAALEKLKTTYVVAADKIPYRITIPGIARQLTKMQRRDYSFKEMRKAQKELARLATDARSLASKIKTILIPPEPPYLEGADWEAEKLSWTARGFLDLACIIGAINLEGTLTEFADEVQVAATSRAGPAGKRGRPTEGAATKLGFYLYQEYERITGRFPTLTVRNNRASGAFLDLVKEVFDALGVVASPEATVRRVMEEMKIRRR